MGIIALSNFWTVAGIIYLYTDKSNENSYGYNFAKDNRNFSFQGYRMKRL